MDSDHSKFRPKRGKIIVRRSGRYTLEDARRVLFPEGPPRRRTLKDLKEGIAESMREQHGRR